MNIQSEDQLVDYRPSIERLKNVCNEDPRLSLLVSRLLSWHYEARNTTGGYVKGESITKELIASIRLEIREMRERNIITPEIFEDMRVIFAYLISKASERSFYYSDISYGFSDIATGFTDIVSDGGPVISYEVGGSES